LRAVCVANDDVQSSKFRGVSVGFVSRIDDWPLNGGFKALYGFEELGALGDLKMFEIKRMNEFLA
jgi:hypothetical protein